MEQARGVQQEIESNRFSVDSSTQAIGRKLPDQMTRVSSKWALREVGAKGNKEFAN